MERRITRASDPERHKDRAKPWGMISFKGAGRFPSSDEPETDPLKEEVGDPERKAPPAL
jgi:hypothetical protein